MATKRKATRKRPRKPANRRPTPVDDDLELAEELLRLPKEQAAIERELDKFMKQLGLLGRKPIGAKKLYEMAIREGLDPEGTEFSRGIIEMREE